ncbi:hypothetical protein LTR08_007144 [Meristemomyces frigidus]|nr:hypothetical protein LTR08_007144 [Meristemomyces frigidus]
MGPPKAGKPKQAVAPSSKSGRPKPAVSKPKPAVSRPTSSKRKAPEAANPKDALDTSASVGGSTPTHAGDWASNARRSLGGSLARAQEGDSASEPMVKRQRRSSVLGVPYNDFALSQDLDSLKRDVKAAMELVEHLPGTLNNLMLQLQDKHNQVGVGGSVEANGRYAARGQRDVKDIKDCISGPGGVLDKVVLVTAWVTGVQEAVDETSNVVYDTKDVVDGTHEVVDETKECVDEVQTTVEDTKELVEEVQETVDELQGTVGEMEEGLKTLADKIHATRTVGHHNYMRLFDKLDKIEILLKSKA